MWEVFWAMEAIAAFPDAVPAKEAISLDRTMWEALQAVYPMMPVRLLWEWTE